MILSIWVAYRSCACRTNCRITVSYRFWMDIYSVYDPSPIHNKYLPVRPCLLWLLLIIGSVSAEPLRISGIVVDEKACASLAPSYTNNFIKSYGPGAGIQ